LQVINYSHLFPTRYALELEGLKGAVTQEAFKEPSQREDAKKTIKKLLEDRYTGGKNKWFFTPLRVSRSLRAPDSHCLLYPYSFERYCCCWICSIKSQYASCHMPPYTLSTSNPLIHPALHEFGLMLTWAYRKRIWILDC
jgi:hypothetical protein